MFSKKQRIDREKVGKIIKSPDFLFNSNLFNVKYSENNLPYPRFSIVISKKVAKSAVSRHFLKRKIVNILKKKEKIKNYDLILFLKSEKITDFEQEIDSFINKCMID